MAKYTNHDVYNVVATLDVTWHELVEIAYAYGMSTKPQTKIQEVHDFLLATIDNMDPQEAALYYPQEHEQSFWLAPKTIATSAASFLDPRPLVAKATRTQVSDWSCGDEDGELVAQVKRWLLAIRVQEGYTIRIDDKKSMSPENQTFLTRGNVVKVTKSPSA